MRSVLRSGAGLALACALFAPASNAQVSTSPGYKLVDIVLDCGGGGSASSSFAAHVTLGDPTGGTLTSVRFNAGLGILETSDPQPTNSPVILGITQDFGPAAGGTLVTISGLNFDKFGVGPSVTVDVGGNAATGVNVTSNTQLTAMVPAGAKGPADVTVTSSFGSDTRTGGYVYTPAIVSTPTASQGGTLELRNYGPTGQVFNTYVSTNTTSANTQYGTLLVGPTNLFLLLGPFGYPGPSGVSSIVLDVPHDPVLEGLTVHFQSLDIFGFGPLTGELTNRSSTTIQ